MTLIEVVLSAGLMATVLVGSLGALYGGLLAIESARMRTLAAQVLQSGMEDLRLMSYAELEARAAQSQPQDLTHWIQSENFTNAFAEKFEMEGRFTVLAAGTDTQFGKIEVELTANWDSQNGTPRTRRMRTWFGEKGLSDYVYVGF